MEYPSKKLLQVVVQFDQGIAFKFLKQFDLYFNWFDVLYLYIDVKLRSFQIYFEIQLAFHRHRGQLKSGNGLLKVNFRVYRFRENHEIWERERERERESFHGKRPRTRR